MSVEPSAPPARRSAGTTRYALLFIARRLLVLVLLLVLVSFGVFALISLAPGSTEQALLGGRPASPQLLASLRHEYGLDRSFFAQYWLWLDHAAHFDLGHSVRTGDTVQGAIGSRAGVTIFLAIYAFVIAVAIGVPLGVIAALRKLSIVDTGIVALSVVGISSPVFATGLVLLYVFGIQLNWFPIYGAGSGFVDELFHLTLPAAALALSAMALVVKFTRAGMIGALAGDHIIFARVRGVGAGRIVIMYALRNALVPIITASGLILTYMLTGTVLVEVSFSLPGIGALLVDSINFKDVPTVQGVAILVAAFVIAVNLVVDLLYLVVDPQIRARAVDG